MIRWPVCLTLAFALLLLGRGAWPPASGAAVEPSVPADLTPAAWQAIQSQVAKLTAADGAAHDLFGFSVSLDGNTVVAAARDATVGGNYAQGAAYVFYRDQGGPGAWGEIAKLTAADGAAWNYFGGSVSVSGDTALVGANWAAVGGNGEQGAVYVFRRNQGGANAWGQVAKLTASDGAVADHFGDSVSVDGDTAVVAASGADIGGNGDQGAAYVFYQDQDDLDTWRQVAKLTAADGTAGANFGGSVSVDGDTTLVGAWGANVGNATQGATYVFHRSQGGTDAWGQMAKLTAADGAANDFFGQSVSVDGDMAVVGAVQAEVGQGAAYVFYRHQGGPDAWGQVAKLTAADGAAQDGFGGSVSVDGDTAVVAASGADAGAYNQGAVYVFYRDQGGPGAWGQLVKLTAADGALGDYFGNSVSLSGDAAIAGAHYADVGGNGDEGAAYVFALFKRRLYLPLVVRSS
jgi:hypothetical protein